MDESGDAGFEAVTRLGTALDRLSSVVDPVDRTERVPVASGLGRVLAQDVTASRPYPHYDRVTIDGFAVVADETFGASGDDPVSFEIGETAGRGTAVPVDGGDELPDGADAVAPAETVTIRDDGVEFVSGVPEGEHVTRTGEDVAAGTTVLPTGKRLRHADLGICQADGRTRIEVVARPTAGVVPTGDVVKGDPAAGEATETDGLVVSSLVQCWGGAPTYRDPVAGEREALRAAIERDLTKDLVVTTGSTVAGAGDSLPAVVADLGDRHVHGVAIDPGRSVGVGVVHDTPVLTLPGAPVSCLVTAMQLVRPAVERAGRRPPNPPTTTTARIDAKLHSEVGVRTFIPVTLDRQHDQPGMSDGADHEDDTGEPGARPVGTTDPSSVATTARADGWVVVPESREGIPAGETVTVADWEYQP